jgi:hypothetical protein
MSKQIYNGQAIKEYLLGSLAETETERFDELSITDDQFAETLKATEKDLVDAYVHGELTGAELERFEFNYVASSLRRDKVNFAQAFQLFAEKNSPAEAAEAQPELDLKQSKKIKTSGWLSALGVFAAPRLTWGFAAAALALLCAGGWLALENLRLRHQMTQTQAGWEALGQREQELQRELEGWRSNNAKTEQELAQVSEERKRLEDELKKEQDRQRVDEKQQPSRPGEGLVVSFILMPQMRGIGQIPTVSVPVVTRSVAIQLELEAHDYPDYRVALIDPSNNQVRWRSGKIRAAGNRKSLTVRLRTALLNPQTYLLQVSGNAASGGFEIVGDYPFRVVR